MRGRIVRIEKNTKWYSTYLTDWERSLLDTLMPQKASTALPRFKDLLEILNALQYLDITGCRW